MDRKCAIYNRQSLKQNEQRLNEISEELILFCNDILEINDFVVFQEIGSVNEKREKFDEMIERINNNEFTDLLVYHPSRIYRPEYDKKKFDEIIENISEHNVNLHSIVNNIDDGKKFIILEYMKLVQYDKKYMEKYIELQGTGDIHNKLGYDCVWRKFIEKEDIIEIINCNQENKLFELADYYDDELKDLLRDYLKLSSEDELEDITSIQNLKELLKKEDTPEQIKECIVIYFRSAIICRELYYIIKQEK